MFIHSFIHSGLQLFIEYPCFLDIGFIVVTQANITDSMEFHNLCLPRFKKVPLLLIRFDPKFLSLMLKIFIDLVS